MLLGIINFLRGYLVLEIKGSFAERFVNIAVNGGVYLWQVRRRPSGVLQLKVSEDGYRRLMQNDIVRGMEIRVIRRRGAPFVLRRYKRRTALFLGPFILIGIILVSNMFVWRVKVEGGEDALNQKTLEWLSAYGVRAGVLKKGIDVQELQRQGIISIDELSWIWLEMRGTTALVKIAPRALPPETVDENAPCDIVSALDGVISRIIARRGEPQVKPGDTVTRGQILVSAHMKPSEGAPERLVHAQAEVYARTWYEKSALISEKIQQREATGREKTFFFINFRRINIKLSINSRIPYKYYDKIRTVRKIPFSDIEFVGEKYLEINRSFISRGKDAALETARAGLLAQIKGDGREIKDVRTEVKDQPDGGYLVTVTAECEERIDQQKEWQSFGENL